MMSSKKVAVTTTSEPPSVGIVMPLGSQQGGAEALLQHLLSYGAGQYRYLCVFLEDGPLVTMVRTLGYDTTVLHTTHLSHPGNYFKTLWALRRWVKAKQLDVVVSWMPKAHMYVSPAAWLLPVRVVWFQHGIPHGDRMDRIATVLPANAVLCCSASSKQGQDRMHPLRASHVCYPGVALATGRTQSRDEARKRLGLPAKVPIIGMVARLENWKGAHVFVAAAAEIVRQAPQSRLFIIGGKHHLEPAYAEKVYAMVEQLRLGEQFILAGQRPMDEVRLWQTAADVMVHPVTGVEPFGMSIVEAMAQGRVVVASNLGGPAEIIEDGVSGILIPRGDSNLLASKVLELLGDSAQRSAMEQQALLRAQRFSVDVFARRFQEVMSEVLLA